MLGDIHFLLGELLTDSCISYVSSSTTRAGCQRHCRVLTRSSPETPAFYRKRAFAEEVCGIKVLWRAFDRAA